MHVWSLPLLYLWIWPLDLEFNASQLILLCCDGPYPACLLCWHQRGLYLNGAGRQQPRAGTKFLPILPVLLNNHI